MTAAGANASRLTQPGANAPSSPAIPAAASAAFADAPSDRAARYGTLGGRRRSTRKIGGVEEATGHKEAEHAHQPTKNGARDRDVGGEAEAAGEHVHDRERDEGEPLRRERHGREQGRRDRDEDD